MKKIQLIIVLVSLSLFSQINISKAQSSREEKEVKKEAAVKAMIDAKHFTFMAQDAIPSGMRTRQLTPDYYLRISKDTIESYLPYFGRAFSAPTDNNNIGIEFKTTDFKYSVVEAKKGGWNISIDFNKAGDTRQMFLYVSKVGYANLNVTSNNKENISFNGYVRE